MDPRKFLKRLARELGLLRNDQSSSTEQKVSEPANFQHRVHVALDENSGGFVGLPPQWKQIVEKTKSDEDSVNENARFVARTRFTPRVRQTSDDRALNRTYLRTSKENFSSIAAALDTPRSRASVADSQDLIIERLKRELREYKARNLQAINESTEDVFERSSTRSLNLASQSMATSSRFSASHHGKFNSTFPRSYVSTSCEFDESLEDEVFPSQQEQSLLSNGNSAKSSKNALSPMKNRNSNGAIPRQSPTKLNGLRANGNVKAFRRSESEV